VLGSNDKSTVGPQFRRLATLLGRISASRNGADGALVWAKSEKASDIDLFLQLQRLVALARNRSPQKIRHEIAFEYQVLIDVVESPLRTRYSGHGRRKFGRICQRFWVRSPLRFVARVIR
jgi:hypothetical protein